MKTILRLAVLAFAGTAVLAFAGNALATQKLSVRLPRGIGSLASRRGTIAARAVASSRSADGLTAAAASKLTITLKR